MYPDAAAGIFDSLVIGLGLDLFLYYCDKELQESHEHTM